MMTRDDAKTRNTRDAKNRGYGESRDDDESRANALDDDARMRCANA